MDMDNEVGTDCGREGWAGWRREKREKMGQYNRINFEK